MGLTIVLYRKQNITTFLFFAFCFLFCFVCFFFCFVFVIRSQRIVVFQFINCKDYFWKTSVAIKRRCYTLLVFKNFCSYCFFNVNVLMFCFFTNLCICLISLVLMYLFTSISAISATTLPPANCEDDSQYKGQCPGWAKIGECQKNPAWMKLHCRKSCKICGKRLFNIITRL